MSLGTPTQSPRGRQLQEQFSRTDSGRCIKTPAPSSLAGTVVTCDLQSPRLPQWNQSHSPMLVARSLIALSAACLPSRLAFPLPYRYFSLPNKQTPFAHIFVSGAASGATQATAFSTVGVARVWPRHSRQEYQRTCYSLGLAGAAQCRSVFNNYENLCVVPQLPSGEHSSPILSLWGSDRLMTHAQPTGVPYLYGHCGWFSECH